MPGHMVKGWVISIASKPGLEFKPLVEVRFNNQNSAKHFAEGYVLGRFDEGFAKTSDSSSAALTWESASEVLRVDDEPKFAERVKAAEWPSED
jgi:hypothetical protein